MTTERQSNNYLRSTRSYLIRVKAEGNLTPKIFHRNIIVATLHEKARVEFIKRGKRNLRGENDVLDLLEEIQEGIEAEMKIKHSIKRLNNRNFKFNDNESMRSNSNDKDGDWCRKKGHNHFWSNCPENRNLKNYKGDDNRQRGDARSQDGSRDNGS